MNKVSSTFWGAAKCAILVVLVSILGLLPSLAEDGSMWKQFRGPGGNGTTSHDDFPTTWSSDQNLAWAKELPGSGWSSPVIAGNRAFVTLAVYEGQGKPKGFQDGVRSMRSYREDGEANRKSTRFEVHCLSLTDGQTLWKETVAVSKPG